MLTFADRIFCKPEKGYSIKVTYQRLSETFFDKIGLTQFGVFSQYDIINDMDLSNTNYCKRFRNIKVHISALLNNLSTFPNDKESNMYLQLCILWNSCQ